MRRLLAALMAGSMAGAPVVAWGQQQDASGTYTLKVQSDIVLTNVVVRDKKTGEVSEHKIRHLFVMTGASPRTEWLRGCLALDSKGFVLTGYDLDRLTLEELEEKAYEPMPAKVRAQPGLAN